MATLSTQSLCFVTSVTPCHEDPAHSLLEPLSAFASARPDGLLILQRPGVEAAFVLCGGRVSSADLARGGTPEGAIEYMDAFVSRFGWGRFAEDAQHPEPEAFFSLARGFVFESLLSELAVAHRVSLVRARAEATGFALPADDSPGLSHVCLELARRADEQPKIVRRLPPEDAVLLPQSAPGNRMARRSPTADDSDTMDFFDDPDPAADGEWADALHVFAALREPMTTAQLIAAAGIGEFRALSAVCVLLSAGHVASASRRVA